MEKRDRKAECARYYQKNRERIKNTNKEYYLKCRKQNPMALRLRNLRARCKVSNIKFNLTEDDLKIPERCPYLGIKLETTHTKRPHFNSASVDRIDPSKGYIKGNVEVISQLANSMKSDASPEQLIIFAKSVLERYSKYE